MVAKKGIQLPSSLVTMAANGNKFSRNLYKELSKEKKENLIVSPFSLSTALSMITPGAKGLTHSQVAHLQDRYYHLFFFFFFFLQKFLPTGISVECESRVNLVVKS